MKKKIWFILDDKQELENGKNKEQHKELGYQTKIGTCNTKKRTRTKDQELSVALLEDKLSIICKIGWATSNILHFTASRRRG